MEVLSTTEPQIIQLFAGILLLFFHHLTNSWWGLRNVLIFKVISSWNKARTRHIQSHAGLQTYLVFLPHLNPAKLRAFIRLDSMTDELVFQAELILKIKHKQSPTAACKKPPQCYRVVQPTVMLKVLCMIVSLLWFIPVCFSLTLWFLGEVILTCKMMHTVDYSWYQHSMLIVLASISLSQIYQY